MKTITDLSSQRVASIDIFRALTMLLMIFVNDFWTLIDVPKWLVHARRSEDMLGFADIVFPCFLFAVGLSIPFAIETRMAKGDSWYKIAFHILLRSFSLLFIGFILANATSRHHADAIISRPIFILLTLVGVFLVWNIYPRSTDWKKYLFIGLQIIGVALLCYLLVTYRDRRGGFMSIHSWSILYLIGWTYFLCAFTYFFARRRLYVHYIALLFLMLLSIAGANRWLGFADGIIISNGGLHVFTMAGVIVSLLLTQYGSTSIRLKKLLAIIAVAGAVFILAGFVARNFWIISKLRYTPTWVLFCTGISMILYAFIYWLTELNGKENWFKIIKPAGTATLTCYLFVYYVYAVYDIWPHISMPDIIRTHPVGLIKSFAFALLMIGCTWLLGKMHIKLKI